MELDERDMDRAFALAGTMLLTDDNPPEQRPHFSVYVLLAAHLYAVAMEGLAAGCSYESMGLTFTLKMDQSPTGARRYLLTTEGALTEPPEGGAVLYALRGGRG